MGLLGLRLVALYPRCWGREGPPRPSVRVPAGRAHMEEAEESARRHEEQHRQLVDRYPRFRGRAAPPR
eukprot:12454959-Alexandrium_andersonii.AAC.1